MPAKETTAPPNIVLIMADDMGYGDVGCYNPDSRIPTPHMDRLAAGGIRFTDAHSASSVCTPSRYGVLTGRYCWRTRLQEGVTGGYEAPLIESSRLTLASMLKEKGYTTACIGKWHVGLDFQDGGGHVVHAEDKVDFSMPVLNGPTALGFDYAYFNAACGTGSPPYGFIENDRFVDDAFVFLDRKTLPYPTDSGMMGRGWVTRDADPIIADKACDWLTEQAGNAKPFFLYLTPNAPHEPCVGEVVPAFARGRSAAGARGDLVWLFDWIVGRVVATLEDSGVLDNTLILVTSDNGALRGDFVLDENGGRVDAGTGRREFVYEDYGHKSCGDWRGYKAHIWEGGHREPLIVHWPGQVAPGGTSDALLSLTDIMATCAAITDYVLPEDAGEDSYNQLPAILTAGRQPVEGNRSTREAMVHHSSFGVFSIRRGRWKLVLDTQSSGGWPTPRGEHAVPGTPGQLYDLHVDPREQNNLWEQRPDRVNELTALLQSYKQAGRSVPRTCGI